MEKVRVEDAVGMVLCHDITEIVPVKFKGRAFAKGHVIQEEDIEKLLDLGKRHIYVWDLSKGYVHENDAALRMVQAAAGENIVFSEVKEGKIELRAACDGVLKINLDTLYAVNSDDEICFATIHGNKQVTKGKLLAATRVIPLAVKEEVLERFEKACKESKTPLVEVKPFRPALKSFPAELPISSVLFWRKKRQKWGQPLWDRCSLGMSPKPSHRQFWIFWHRERIWYR